MNDRMRRLGFLALAAMPALGLSAQQGEEARSPFAVAQARAAAAGKDLLVVVTDLGNDKWSRRLHDRVLCRPGFARGLAADFEWLRLDRSQDSAVLAGNAALAGAKNASMVLLSASGDEFGTVLYRNDSVAGYLRKITEVRKSARGDVVQARALIDHWRSAGEKERAKAWLPMFEAFRAASKSRAKQMLGEALVRDLSPAVGDEALQQDVAAALLGGGFASKTLSDWATRFDATNERGLLELTLVPQFAGVRSAKAARRALASFDRFAARGLRDSRLHRRLLTDAVRWSQGLLADTERARGYARTLLPMLSESDSEAHRWLKRLLAD